MIIIGQDYWLINCDDYLKLALNYGANKYICRTLIVKLVRMDDLITLDLTLNYGVNKHNQNLIVKFNEMLYNIYI